MQNAPFDLAVKAYVPSRGGQEPREVPSGRVGSYDLLSTYCMPAASIYIGIYSVRLVSSPCICLKLRV